VSEDDIHNAANVISLSFALIYPLQMSLKIWKVGQSPTEIDRSETKEITFHRPNHGLNPHKQHVVLAPLLDTVQLSQCPLTDSDEMTARYGHHLIIVCQRSCRTIVDCILAVSKIRLYLL